MSSIKITFIVDGVKTTVLGDKNKTVLDVFSHVGGFALAALVGGAVEATAVDASQPALELAEQGAEVSGFKSAL